ncbi:metal-sensing transcriptional repressor [Achromobacter denitrificans]|uniref:Metal-sensing transcriptional repressor n=1 Tax=Achromobacter denitrificans TaxID=32002 RepID=A0ABZ3FXM1_ACHDE|nr:metal-sensing transcriptional repressor [Achromobacter denitrificans]MDF3851621.1 metal-sensing transcriptional repressor [Achromobacter denitrificans]MDF3858614.1 metal-sensing transcriptional repressor [Achromobacter denitrificans]MDF3938424.1 metal-sensing transcriptional repressor [Achromobacter denitrificans]MDX3878868.1 metal-sensing transcriptional repressor [Achromobacter sp.]
MDICATFCRGIRTPSCLELCQQLHAVERAISQAKKIFIQDPLDHCLQDAVPPVVAGVFADLCGYGKPPGFE